MATKAYFMITVDNELDQEGYLDVLKELEAVPEVKSIEPVEGFADLMVTVEAPIRVILVANRILAKEWVKGLKVLKVTPSQRDGALLAGGKAIDTLWSLVQSLEESPVICPRR